MLKYSIIIPVYNVENYLNKCIDSVLSQTHQNFEVICINDGSTDSSLSILKEYQKNNSNLILLDQKNNGLGGARNSGVLYATGDYIWFVDSDDWIEEDALLQLDNFINKVGLKDIILFDTYRTDGTNKTVMKTIPKCNLHVLPEMYYLKKLLLRSGIYSAWNKIFLREKYQKSGYQFEAGFYEDIPLMKYYYEQNCSMAYMQKPLYNYYLRSNSIMKTYDERILSIFHQYGIVYDTLSNSKEFDKFISAFFYHVMLATIRKPMNSTIKDEFWTKYNNIKTNFPYFSKYCMFNNIITIKHKILICIELIPPYLLHYINNKR